MSSMRVKQELCTLCGQCVAVCPFGGVKLLADSVVFTDSCRLCGICIRACPTEAIWLKKAAEAEEVDKSQYKNVFIFAEQRENMIQPVTYELIGKGLELAKKLGQEVEVGLLGAGISHLAEELLEYGAAKVYFYDHIELSRFRIEPYTALLVELVEEIKPNIILMGATPVGRSLAPRLAARLRTGLTADCTFLSVKENGDLVQTRPAFGGNVMAQIVTPKHRPQMATVRPKVMPQAARVTPFGQIIERKPAEDMLHSAIEVLNFRPYQAVESVADAEIIVCAGRGVAKEEDLGLLEKLAALLGGVLGVTRPLVEQGWAGQERQVGMSGRTVRPKLFIACGISGAIQHVAGMRSSDVIFAINTDPKAPIFDVAHFGLVGDLYEIVPGLIRAIEEGGSLDAVYEISS
ncbi:MAG TPA: electron transfer flavoprotein subunit alpha [Firmicutes bacterium]|nr:electron transfer flavoprotein subunit alpha [Bacillota bacterium]